MREDGFRVGCAEWCTPLFALAIGDAKELPNSLQNTNTPKAIVINV